MAERSYFVKLNLDDMAASLDALDSTEERGQWLEGFRVGSRGNAPRDGWPEAKAIGHTFGLSCWEKAEEFREKQSAKGKASGMARSNRTESEPESNHGSTTVQPRMNQPPNREGTNQKPETRSQQQETTSEQPKARAKARTVFSEDMFDHLIPDPLKSDEFVSMWHSWVRCRIGKRKPITSEAAAMQIEMLSKYPTEIAIGCIRTSIANDWQGLFEPKESTPTRNPQPTKPKWTGFTADYYADGPVVQKL